MSKELEKNVQEVRIAITKLIGTMVSLAVDEALIHAAAKAGNLSRTPPAAKPQPKSEAEGESRSKTETKVEPQPKVEPETLPAAAEEPTNLEEETDGVGDFFTEEGEETPTTPEESGLSFQDVSKVFFSRFREVSVLLGVEKATDITRNLLKKYTNGKALSKATLPKEKYGEFLEKVEGIHARALEIKEQGNG